MANTNPFDVIIVGGSYAGLSAAISLGRSLRNVLIIDSGLPCNQQTPHSHNFLTQDGKPPKEIASLARQQLEEYKTVQFQKDFATSAKKTDSGFVVKIQSGETFSSKKLILATGIKDTIPEIKGFAECWGISVIHCPYCHGYEYRNQKTGIIANGERAFHIASLVSNLTNDITVLTSGKADFKSDQIKRFNTHNIKVLESEISEIEHDNRQIKHVIFNNGIKITFKAVYAALPFTQHSDIPVSLGCELTEQGYIKVDGMQKTTIDGVFACGDNSAMMRSIANAVYSGNLAGAMVNKELKDEQF
jgi:thioredoxin reductase